MHDPSHSRRRTMSFPLPPTTAANWRLARLLMTAAVAVLACVSSPISRAQDVPAAPAPQPPPLPAQPQAVHLQDYSKPRPPFPTIRQPSPPHHLPHPNPPTPPPPASSTP